jgi:twinkle protein
MGKHFKLGKDAELIFYNLDCLEGAKECLIVEGEIDALSVYEAGYYTVLSVPNGASKGSQKLEYLDNCWEHFTDIQKIIIWTDNDEAGYNLREELARRIGKEKCFRVQHFADCKDANEVLVKHGKETVLQMIEEAQPFPIEGIITMDEMFEDVTNFYHNGYPQGVKTGIEGLDEYVSFMTGQFTTVTGIPGSGKSEFVDYIMCQLSKLHGWGWGVCSFENQPSSIHVTKLIEKLTGKSFAFRRERFNRVSEEEMFNACIAIHEHFHFINIHELDVTLTGILEKAEELVKRKGIKGLLIDPWNYIEHKIPKGYTETQYISESLTKLKSFALRTGVHVILIAHPTKIQKDKATKKYDIPTLYQISGSAHFFNKTDNGITVYRDFQTNIVEIHVQKVRYSWLGKVGLCGFNYDIETRHYSPTIL